MDDLDGSSTVTVCPVLPFVDLHVRAVIDVIHNVWDIVLDIVFGKGFVNSRINAMIRTRKSWREFLLYL